MKEIKNNFHCCDGECRYRTFAKNEKEALEQLNKDGGYDRNKTTFCPICKKDSLVFINE